MAVQTPVLVSVAIGLATGVLSGLLGIGGGLVSTPALRLILGVPPMIAVGTPLVIIVPTTVSAAWTYARRGNLDVRAALAIGSVGAVAAAFGAGATAWVDGSQILVLTAGILAAAAWRLAFGRPVPEVQAVERRRWRLVIVGVAAGLFSGFFGLGGGSIIVPGLVRLLGMPMRRAVGTSLVAITVLALPGVGVHAALAHIDWDVAFWVALGVLPGAVLGARLAHLGDELWLRRAFAVFLGAVAVMLAVGEWMSR